MACNEREQRVQSRLKMKESHDLTASVGRSSSGFTETVEADVVNISSNGIKLRLESALQFGEVVSLTLKSPILDLAHKFNGEVRWVKPGTNQWMAGLVAKNPVPAEFIQRMAISGLLERRRGPRSAVEGTAILRVPGDTEGIEVQLIDKSDGGLKLLAPKAVEVGQRVMMVFEEKK